MGGVTRGGEQLRSAVLQSTSLRGQLPQRAAGAPKRATLVCAGPMNGSHACCLCMLHTGPNASHRLKYPSPLLTKISISCTDNTLTRTKTEHKHSAMRECARVLYTKTIELICTARRAVLGVSSGPSANYFVRSEKDRRGLVLVPARVCLLIDALAFDWCSIVK